MTNTGCHLAVLIKEQVTLHPDRIAVISKAGEATYQEMARYVNGISAELIDRGIVRETPVAVCADRSLAWVAGLLGVLEAGGIYIPVDPMSPLQRKAQMLEDARARLLLIEPHLAIPLPGSIEPLRLGADQPRACLGSSTPEVMPGQAAYGIYTSGSTGTPKSVIVSHDSLGNYARVLRQELVLTTSDRYLHTASLAFSASIRQLVAPLVSGAALVIATREELRDPASLISRMVQANVTVFDTVPSFLTRWLAAVLESPRDWRDRLEASLRLVLTTGEALAAGTVKALRATFPKIRVLNLYGQTETTGTVSLHEADSSGPDPVPIGRALNPCRFYVLDAKMDPTSAGELYISGPAIARCYHRRPDITASRFLADPFSGIPGARMYRTGDLVRCSNNGLLEFQGRVDDQVKIHGIRVELGEIEAALLKHPDVQQSATVLRPVGTEDSRLVVFVVMKSGRRSSPENLRTFLTTALPEPMVPGVVVFAEDLPRTASGKVDRQALITAQISPPSTKTSSGAPRTQIERLVARCWEEALRLTDLGVDDDFFALGGDSLQAIQMTFRLQKLLPVQLPLGTLFFQDPTLKGFATAIEEKLGNDDVLSPDQPDRSTSSQG